MICGGLSFSRVVGEGFVKPACAAQNNIIARTFLYNFIITTTEPSREHLLMQ